MTFVAQTVLAQAAYSKVKGFQVSGLAVELALEGQSPYLYKIRIDYVFDKSQRLC